MIKNEHNVVFWESGRNEKETIPVCEATPLLGTNSTYNCVLLNDRPSPNARECRRLLKRGLSWHVLKQAVQTEKDELEGLFHYQVVLKDRRRIRNRDRDEYHFFFKKYKQIGTLDDSCYVADDRCIVLLKFIPPMLKLCYLDLASGKTYFHKVVSLDTFISLKLGNGSIWLIQSLLRSSTEMMLLVPNRSFSNCIVMRGRLTLSSPKPKLYFSSHCFVSESPKGYLLYDEKKHCLVRKSINVKEFENFGKFFLFGTLFFATRTEEEGLPPIFYHGVMEPEMQITKVVDLSQYLHQYKNYVQDSFEVYVFHRPMKALLMSYESYILVLDLLTGKVCQILSYIPCFWQHKLSIYFSLDSSSIKLIGKYKQSEHKTEYLCINFRTWHCSSLKDICKRSILTNFSYETLIAQNIPKFLKHELERYYIYKNEISKY